MDKIILQTAYTNKNNEATVMDTGRKEACQEWIVGFLKGKVVVAHV
ncbi:MULTISPECIES: hypothetical protein [Hwangdonia]|uniref:Uncharacterized protein n=1 Tax=Hwangdonia seohaensis TaxID=1240727 RepID=A0ABW3RA56_9FLAO|nr:hypothetical protein [Hwangdonia seohaensis]